MPDDYATKRAKILVEYLKGKVTEKQLEYVIRWVDAIYQDGYQDGLEDQDREGE